MKPIRLSGPRVAPYSNRDGVGTTYSTDLLIHRGDRLGSPARPKALCGHWGRGGLLHSVLGLHFSDLPTQQTSGAFYNGR